jgi:quercetin dioxygenase-like cupin family protein
MNRGLRYGVALAALGLLATLGYGVAQAQTEPPPIVIETLTPRAVFTDDVAMQARLKLDGEQTGVINIEDPSRMVTIRVTVQPGAQIPWHTHPGPVFVTIAQGELTYVSADDCVGRQYGTGTAFVDPGHGHVHTAYNSGSEGTVFVATFFEAPETGPITIPATGDCPIPAGS